MTIIVTGGAGFIGANFVRDWFAVSDEPIVTLDKLTYAGNPANLGPIMEDPRHRLVEGDIADGDLVARLLDEENPRALINFAAESHVDRSIAGPAAFMATNVNGTFVLLEAVRRHLEQRAGAGADTSSFRFIQVSTDEVYGSLEPDEPPCDEARAYAPNSPYSASKAAADHLVRAYFHTYRLPVVTTNCSNNYGPLQFPEKFIPVIIDRAMERAPIPLYGDGLNVRDWLHVSDHCAAIRQVLDKGRIGQTYNIGGENEVSNMVLVNRICGLLDELLPEPGPPRASLITPVADRPGHDRRYAIDSAKLRKETGWVPARGFEDGLRDTVNWYLANRAWIAAARDRAKTNQ